MRRARVRCVFCVMLHLRCCTLASVFHTAAHNSPSHTAIRHHTTTTEAIVRGHKAGLLTVPDYNNLTQCEALDDIKLNLVRALAAAAVM
jgi:hypothetical protein